MKYIVKRDTGRGDIYEDVYVTREYAEYKMEYMKAHPRDFQIDDEDASVSIEEVSMSKEDIEAIADEIGYSYDKYDECWLDYCDSVMSDTSVTEEQVRSELLDFMKIDL